MGVLLHVQCIDKSTDPWKYDLMPKISLLMYVYTYIIFFLKIFYKIKIYLGFKI